MWIGSNWLGMSSIGKISINAAAYLRVPLNDKSFLTSGVVISVSRKILFHGLRSLLCVASCGFLSGFLFYTSPRPVTAGTRWVQMTSFFNSMVPITNSDEESPLAIPHLFVCLCRLITFSISVLNLFFISFTSLFFYFFVPRIFILVTAYFLFHAFRKFFVLKISGNQSHWTEIKIAVSARIFVLMWLFCLFCASHSVVDISKQVIVGQY